MLRRAQFSENRIEYRVTINNVRRDYNERGGSICVCVSRGFA